MEIKVLGTGCAKCKTLYAATEQAVKEMNFPAEIEKIEDIERIMEYNTMTLPALVVDGKVVAKGVMSVAQVKDVLKEFLPKVNF